MVHVPVAGEDSPRISIIITTYNRARLVGKAIDSVLQQTYQNFEIIVVDDGSTDDTVELLEAYGDNRMRVIRHDGNKGVTVAKNSGLNAVSGEWFTFLDSDDTMIPSALARMVEVIVRDTSISAITCNCIDSVTGAFTGQGLSREGNVDTESLIRHCKGEFWGITRTDLLRGDRFNEKLSGWENVLWYKVNARAKRYYLPEGLRIYRTEGEDRLSSPKAYNRGRSIRTYAEVSKETEFLRLQALYAPEKWVVFVIKGLLMSLWGGDFSAVRSYLSVALSKEGRGALKRNLSSYFRGLAVRVER